MFELIGERIAAVHTALRSLNEVLEDGPTTEELSPWLSSARNAVTDALAYRTSLGTGVSNALSRVQSLLSDATMRSQDPLRLSEAIGKARRACRVHIPSA